MRPDRCRKCGARPDCSTCRSSLMLHRDRVTKLESENKKLRSQRDTWLRRTHELQKKLERLQQSFSAPPPGDLGPLFRN